MSNPSPIFRPKIFEQFPQIVAAMSLRNQSRPGNNSLLARGASEDDAAANRQAFVEALGFDESRLAVPKLQHSDTIIQVGADYRADWPRADALITEQAGWLIGVGVADCVTVLLYDPTHHALAAVHSGWRGTVAQITPQTILKLRECYKTRSADLYAWISPAPDRFEYEVGREVSSQFNERYASPRNKDKDWLDNKLAVYDQLLEAGVPAEQIQVDPRSTVGDAHLHSARRDGEGSGRMLMAIGLRAT